MPPGGRPSADTARQITDHGFRACWACGLTFDRLVAPPEPRLVAIDAQKEVGHRSRRRFTSANTGSATNLPRSQGESVSVTAIVPIKAPRRTTLHVLTSCPESPRSPDAHGWEVTEHPQNGRPASRCSRTVVPRPGHGTPSGGTVQTKLSKTSLIGALRRSGERGVPADRRRPVGAATGRGRRTGATSYSAVHNRWTIVLPRALDPVTMSTPARQPAPGSPVMRGGRRPPRRRAVGG